MTLDWLRQEVQKEPNEINWLEVMNTAKSLYREDNENTTVFGLSKGFVNFVKCRSTIYSNDLRNELLKIYKPDDLLFITVDKQSDLNKMLKGSQISSDVLSRKLIIVFTDKNTVEPLFNKYNVPYLKFNFSRTWTTPKVFKWKKEGSKQIVWKLGEVLSFKRENVIEELLSDDN